MSICGGVLGVCRAGLLGIDRCLRRFHGAQRLYRLGAFGLSGFGGFDGLVRVSGSGVLGLRVHGV